MIYKETLPFIDIFKFTFLDRTEWAGKLVPFSLAPCPVARCRRCSFSYLSAIYVLQEWEQLTVAGYQSYTIPYQAIPNGRWFVFYFTHHTFLQTETTLLLYFYVAKVTRAINKAQITQAILNKFVQEHLRKSKIWVSWKIWTKLFGLISMPLIDEST